VKLHSKSPVNGDALMEIGGSGGATCSFFEIIRQFGLGNRSFSRLTAYTKGRCCQPKEGEVVEREKGSCELIDLPAVVSVDVYARGGASAMK
jgi:hypothetical protein